jgi:hypothetical protein
VGGAVGVFTEEFMFEAVLKGDVSVDGTMELLWIEAMVKTRLEFDEPMRVVRRFTEERAEVKSWWSRRCFTFGTEARTSAGVVRQGDCSVR